MFSLPTLEAFGTLLGDIRDKILLVIARQITNLPSNDLILSPEYPNITAPTVRKHLGDGRNDKYFDAMGRKVTDAYALACFSNPMICSIQERIFFIGKIFNP